jgi:hypothetical protein
MIALWMQVWRGRCEPAWLEHHFASCDSRGSAFRTWYCLLVPHVPSCGIVAGCAYVAVDGQMNRPAHQIRALSSWGAADVLPGYMRRLDSGRLRAVRGDAIGPRGHPLPVWLVDI